MASLEVKTRAGSTAQGKQKVFFSAHPADHRDFFDSLSDNILKKQNCAVYHSPTGEITDTDLEEMQLIVLPISSRFLYEKCEARESVLSFALSHHIPVLPILTEEGLAQDFNRICGSLQYLDPHESDSTALSFEEKLGTFLSSVLIGNEMTEKIRASFSAYIFLSYRKKDRAYAKALMQKIHENDFCRDIAIWYDEYLVPGEDFDHSIAAALEKSRLFVLAVTPNLVNEENYVMTTEYPMARTAKKPILPFTLVETDVSLLKKKYKDIPDTIDIEDADAVSAALLDALGEVVQAKNDSPEHKFLIGLAYLGGIDVEVDNTRALSLITDAAEAECEKAISMLVTMYRMGLGCPRNYDAAVFWQKKLISVLQKRCEKEPSEKALNDLFWANVSCGDYLKELFKLPESKLLYYQALALVNGKSDKKSVGNLTIVLNRLGTIFKDEGNLEKAEEYLGNALSIDQSLFVAEERAESLLRLLISHINLGDTVKQRGMLEKALVHYEHSLKYATALVEKVGWLARREDLATCCNRLGDTLLALGRGGEAKTYFERALEISEAVDEETKTQKARRSVALCFQRLGESARFEKNLPEAKAYYEKAKDIVLRLAEQTGKHEARYDLSITYLALGDIVKEENRPNEAVDYYAQALAIRQSLAEETETVEVKRGLLQNYTKLGTLAKSIGRRADARSYLEEAALIARNLAQCTQALNAKKDLCTACINLGDLSKGEKRFSNARVWFEEALSLLLSLLDTDETVGTERELAITYTKLGDVAKGEGRIPDAKHFYEKAEELFPALLKKCKELPLKKLFYFLLLDLTAIAEAEGRTDDKKAYLEKTVEITLSIATEEQTAEARWDLSTSCYMLADLAKSETRYGDAVIRYKHAISAAPKITEATAPRHLNMLAASHYYLGFFLADKAVKKENFTRAAEIYRYLSKAYPQVEGYLKNYEAMIKALDALAD